MSHLPPFFGVAAFVLAAIFGIGQIHAYAAEPVSHALNLPRSNAFADSPLSTNLTSGSRLSAEPEEKFDVFYMALIYGIPLIAAFKWMPQNVEYTFLENHLIIGMLIMTMTWLANTLVQDIHHRYGYKLFKEASGLKSHMNAAYSQMDQMETQMEIMLSMRGRNDEKDELDDLYTEYRVEGIVRNSLKMPVFLKNVEPFIDDLQKLHELFDAYILTSYSVYNAVKEAPVKYAPDLLSDGRITALQHDQDHVLRLFASIDERLKIMRNHIRGIQKKNSHEEIIIEEAWDRHEALYRNFKVVQRDLSSKMSELSRRGAIVHVAGYSGMYQRHWGARLAVLLPDNSIRYSIGALISSSLQRPKGSFLVLDPPNPAVYV